MKPVGRDNDAYHQSMKISACAFGAKYADYRERGQSVPRPVLRPALC
ncbi:hypothetical protein X773_34065 [Mesorhizobium sp. LSJC285A00]|nr:hypothetical protein X773_34065 [Mesorhizobium sp. LSJC285A00]